MKEHKLCKAIFIFVCCFLWVLGLGDSPVFGQQKNPIRLGINLDVTGQAGWTGEPALRAVQLFVEQINVKGGIDGRPIELVIYDNETNPEKALNNAKKLVQRDRVVAIIGPCITSTTNAVKQVAQEEKVVMYSHSGSFKPDYPDSFMFCTWPETPAMIETIYDYFTKKGIKRIATLCATESTGETWAQETARLGKKYGFEITGERFNVKDLDVTSQLANLRGNNPQALIVGVTGKPTAVVAKNFIQMGLDIPYVTGHGNISDSFLNLMQGNEPDKLLLPGVHYVVWKDLPESFGQKKLMQEFSEAYRRRYSKEADVYTVLGYDSVRVLAEAIRQVKPENARDSIKVRDAIEKIKNFPAVMGGNYNFSKEDHRGITKDATVMLQVRGGKFRLAQ